MWYKNTAVYGGYGVTVNTGACGALNSSSILDSRPMEVDVKKTARTATRWIGSPQSISVHTFLFAASFGAAWTGFVDVDRMLLILTTIVSLEAIYLAIFIQMTINEQAEDIDEIQEDIDEIQEDVEEIHNRP